MRRWLPKGNRLPQSLTQLNSVFVAEIAHHFQADSHGSNLEQMLEPAIAANYPKQSTNKKPSCCRRQLGLTFESHQQNLECVLGNHLWQWPHFEYLWLH